MPAFFKPHIYFSERGEWGFTKAPIFAAYFSLGLRDSWQNRGLISKEALTL